MARIVDVASKAGVSVATVSRVINNNPKVRPDARQRVLNAIAELDYQPSGIARNMRHQSARVIGLIVSDIQNPFFTALARAVEDVAHENQYTVLLCNSDEDCDKEALYLDIMVTERAAGVIMVLTGSTCNLSSLERKMPVVLVDRRAVNSDLDAVVLDNVRVGYDVTRHLLSLGHRRIGLVGLPTNISVGEERFEGYRRALNEDGLGPDDCLVRIAAFKEEDACVAAHELLALKPRPTALIAANVPLTIGTLQAIDECGLRIPEDISLVAIHDVEWMRLLRPQLTAISLPTYHLGAEAARLLFRRINEGTKGPTQTIVLPPRLVVRSSTTAPSAGNQDSAQ